MDAVLVVKRRLCIYCFAMESRKFRINRDLNLWSSLIPHLMCELVNFPGKLNGCLTAAASQYCSSICQKAQLLEGISFHRPKSFMVLMAIILASSSYAPTSFT